MTALRRTLAIHAPRPSHEFRRKAWQVFEQALDRHLAGRRTAGRLTERLH